MGIENQVYKARDQYKSDSVVILCFPLDSNLTRPYFVYVLSCQLHIGSGGSKLARLHSTVLHSALLT